jgi:hypothetical protein
LTSADAFGTIERSGSEGALAGGEIKMDETAATPKTDAEYEAEIDAMLAEMRRADEKSRDTREEIERLKAGSKRIHASSDAIAAQTDWRLDAIARILEEMEQDRKLARLRHENLVLRLEKILLHIERRLPPGNPSAKPGTEQS